MSFNKLCVLTVLLCSISCKPSNQAQPETQTTAPPDDEALFTISFGSCNKHDENQNLWIDIINEQSDLWIWLGDNVYGDTDDMEVLQYKYDQQLKQPHYKTLAQSTKIIGTWDDHDYGINDGDKHYVQKKESRELALDFLGVSDTAAVRKRTGMYQSYVFDASGKTIRVLLLDIRYFRDAIARKNKVYIKDEQADILGAEQWTWLTHELSKKEDVLIIGNGLQILPTEHRFEKWDLFPKSRAKLLTLLDQDDCDHIILLSGDRHLGELSQITMPNKTITEATSSGLTHSYRGTPNESNQYRIGPLVSDKNYGVLQVLKNGAIKIQIKGENGVERNQVLIN